MYCFVHFAYPCTFFFFFSSRRRHTRLQGDWSSDVCSSDLVDDAKRILWQFPRAGSLPVGQRFSADDAFLASDGRTIVANDEAHQVIDRIDIASRKVIWQYGHYGTIGSAAGFLHTPDDAYPLANGDIVVADIRNCRILEVNRAKQIVRHWGTSGSCRG